MLTGLDQLNTGYKFEDGKKIQYLAYADDLCIASQSKTEIEDMINKMEEFTNWAQLKFNAAKCSSLSAINSRRHKYVESYSPTLNNESIPALKWEDRYKYLGTEFGRSRDSTLNSLKSTLLKEAELIANSLLTDWQKIEAINIFVLSKANYHLRASTPYRIWARSIDNKIRKILRPRLKLPRSTTTPFFYTATHHGGMGLYSVEDSLDVARVTQFYKCLTSPDKFVRNCAWSQLQEVVWRRTKTNSPSPEVIQNFLNDPPAAQEGTKGDVYSLWTIVRKSLQRLGTTVNILPNNQIHLELQHGSIAPIHRRFIAKALRKDVQSQQLERLIAAPDQGRAFSLISKSPASSHWVNTGQYTSFAAYRFGMKARCNLLPTRTVLKRSKLTNNTTCPKCHQQPETLAHVLNACTPNAGLMRARHNSILSRLQKATHKDLGTIFMDQTIPGSPDILRPDLVVKNNNTSSITIVDVTIPMETGPEAFEKARSEKTQKYAALVQWARTKYQSVNFGVFIIGSLGSWDIKNEETLKMLGIGYKYSLLFRKLCCSDAIEGSLQIWKTRK